MDFNDWIGLHGGDVGAANVLEVKPRTVKSWRRGERVPGVLHAKNIVLRSGGDVDYNGLYGPLAEMIEAAEAAKEKATC